MTVKQPYQPPKLEPFQYKQITAGISFPIGTNSLEPMNDFLELPEEQ
jgi:hypothetical protein